MTNGIRGYGLPVSVQSADPAIQPHLREIKQQGFTILPDVLGAKELEIVRKKIDAIYKAQRNEFRNRNLESIGEADMARCLLAYDEHMLRLATQPRVLDIARQMIGSGYVILHLQNGIINRPDQVHHQTAWHRDLPYQDFVSSKPLAVSALFCIDEFTVENGCTLVVPGSHRTEGAVSTASLERSGHAVTAKAGSVVMFDSMVYHRAGQNRSKNVRRAVNQMYTTPIIKQQINMSRCLDRKKWARSEDLRRLLGFESDPSGSVRGYRSAKFKKASRTRHAMA